MNILHRNSKAKTFNRCGEIGDSWSGLQKWYQSRLGKLFAQQERSLLEDTLSNLFGYHLLQVGRPDSENWLAGSRVSHCEVMDFAGQGELAQAPGFCGLPEHLPIQSDSMDVLVLPHVLEFSQHPHAVLREIERTLIPEGHLVLLVFNPFSLWKFPQWLPGLRNRKPWCGRFLSTTRIRDWLALLGFDVVKVQGYFYRPALQQMSLIQRMAFIERFGGRFWSFLGAANLILARKRVMTLTPLGRSWTRPKAQIVSPPGLVEPFRHRPHLDNPPSPN